MRQTTGPVSKVGAVGYCYGGGYPLVLARGTEPPPASASMTQDCLVDAIAVAHTTIKVGHLRITVFELS